MVDRWTNPTTASLRGEDSRPLQQTFSSLSSYLEKLDNAITAAAASGVTSLTAGTGIGLSSGTGVVTVSNTGVTSLAGTANQVTVSAGTGNITLSLPQNIHTGARPTFAGLDIGTTNLHFGATTRQMINLWSNDPNAPQYGIGVQSGTQYFRTGSNFAWFVGGSHSDATINPGGGTRIAYMNTNGLYVENGWLRTVGTTGLYFESYGGGFRMTDNDWIRIYNGKGLWGEYGTIGTNGGFCVNGSGTRSYSVDVTGTMRTTGRYYSNEWIQMDNYSGLYSPLNAAHFYPNTGSYGSWRVSGSRNSWRGLEFDGSQGGNLSLMMDTNNVWGAQYTGVHNNSYGWLFWVQGQGMRTDRQFPMYGNNSGWIGAPWNAEGAWAAVFTYSVINYSDYRTKHGIENISSSLEFIKRLRPVTFRHIYENHVTYEPDESGVMLARCTDEPSAVDYGNRIRHGFIAQDVKQALEDCGYSAGDFAMWGLGDKDDPDSIQQLEYLQFIAPLTRAVQELAEKIERIEATHAI